MRRLAKPGFGMICVSALAWTLCASGHAFADDDDDDHRSYGSAGGSYGSHGSSGGSYGSAGGHYRAHGYSGGHYQAYGSSGGSYGSHGSSGGSSGGGHVIGSNRAPTYAQSPDRAWMVMSVPQDAVVYLENQRMTMTGGKRRFYTPPLKANKDYVYTVRVEIKRGEEVVSTTSKVKVRAQRNVMVTFTEQDAGQLVSSTATLGRNQL